MTVKLASLAMPDGSRSEAAIKDESPPRFAFLRRKTKVRVLRVSSGNSDRVIMIGGIALAAVCALFPWYIFFNQEDFGIRPLAFDARVPDMMRPDNLPGLVGKRIPQQMISFPELDFSTTGTVSAAPPAAPASQAFPGDGKGFHLVDAANGRALIEDDDGFWIVQRGSTLPDGSRVAQIRRDNGTWQIITSRKAIISLQNSN